MSIITKTILASLEIRPQESDKPQPKSLGNLLLDSLSPTYTISYKTRKLLALSLPAWYLAWSLANLLPEALKPDIDVVSLIEWDRSMFGYLPHQVLNQYFRFTVYGFPLVDFLMAIPYSLHVLWPISFVTWCARTKRWNILIAFVNCFGIASFTAVLTELFYPTAPPWYLENFGLERANYTIPGNPGGLARVDEYFEGQFYHNTFSKSPLVFGAFPSLHVGWPLLLVLFVAHAPGVCNNHRLKLGVLLYFAWVCFAVVYLHHHYVIDVIGGAAYVLITYHFAGPHRDHIDAHPKGIAKRT